MNIEPTSKLYWILQNVAPHGWSYPNNFCALFRQLLGLVIIGLLIAVAGSAELCFMALTATELFFRDGMTILVEGEEIYQTWTELYLDVGAGPAAFMLIFGALGWVVGAIVLFVYAIDCIANTDWYIKMYSNYAVRKEARQAAKTPKIPSEAWILFTTWIESVHEKTCPMITYERKEPTDVG